MDYASEWLQQHPRVDLVAARIPRALIERVYKMKLPLPALHEDQNRNATAGELLRAYSAARGLTVQHGRPDEQRAGRAVLKDFINGKLLFSGDNSYRSRSLRYLGVMTLDHERLALPLVKGDNELIVAVSESFGGWGVTGRFDSLDGLVLEPAHPEKLALASARDGRQR